MNTFLNYLVVASLFALVAAPAVVGLARERRIDRELREAERMARTAGPPETEGAAQPVTAARRPYLRSWARI
ncbi:hypothetical protein RI138_23120 [Streptomyces sp. C11-1]|uniref:Secreted protein n=1 Tax=Streptomyces durocortorensis TaxID=2811104 RepID=A0ABY9W0Y7_9ACTN|nr:hypothetical protein [Streptomyces durocortorensis]WNF29483.1 hypothetical protein RI138_23120 [Streptomyces durocortorensis]